MTRKANKKENILRGTRLNYNASIQRAYTRKLNKLIERMASYTKNQLIKLFKSSTAKQFYAMDDSISSQARILTNALTKKFNQLFADKSKPLAEEMIKANNSISAIALSNSLKKLAPEVTINTKLLSPALKEIIKSSTVESTALIKSISSNYLSNVQKAVMRSITNGGGLKTLIPQLNKFEGISKRHAKNMALDQTRKVYNSFNKGRLEKIGINKFEWLHSGGGEKPRQSHIALSGQIFSYDDLPIINQEQVEKGYEAPERGIPGQAINCRCTMTPVIEFEDEAENDSE